MSLFKPVQAPRTAAKQSITDKIKMRRRQILVHSALYYALDFNIISDDKFDLWAKDLKRLQDENPECVKCGVYDEEFKNFDGCSGYNLPFRSPEIMARAEWLKNEYTKNK